MSFKVTCDSCGQEASFTAVEKEYYYSKEVVVDLSQEITIRQDEDGIYSVQCNNVRCHNKIEAREEQTTDLFQTFDDNESDHGLYIHINQPEDDEHATC